MRFFMDDKWIAIGGVKQKSYNIVGWVLLRWKIVWKETEWKEEESMKLLIILMSAMMLFLTACDSRIERENEDNRSVLGQASDNDNDNDNDNKDDD